jgi:hypothetical protein
MLPAILAAPADDGTSLGGTAACRESSRLPQRRPRAVHRECLAPVRLPEGTPRPVHGASPELLFLAQVRHAAL